METALVTTTNNSLSIDEMGRVATAMAGSGYFKDANDVSKAMVKVLAGQEMGLGPFSSMTGIHIISGKPVLGANLIATLIKNDPRYDYQIAELDNDGCTIDFYERGALVGNSSFNKADAVAAQLTSGNWKKYPRNMFFARAISNGARWYAPGIFGGAVFYTADEMGADMDEDGYVIEVVPVPDEPEPEPNGVEPQDTRAASAPQAQDQREAHRPKAENGFTVEDRREFLKSKFKNGSVDLGIVGDAAAMTEHYNDWTHAKNAMIGNDDEPGFDFPDGFKIIRAQKVTNEGALKIYDWLMSRKEAEDG
jgi:hypothetical protein